MRFGPRLTPVVTWIIAVNLGVFLVWLFAGKAAQALFVRWLVLTPGSLAEGHVWKLVTTSLFNLNALAFVFDMLMLWLFIPILEQLWTRKKFIIFALVTTVAGNLASALVGLLIGGEQLIVGLSPFVYATIAAYGVAYADQQIQFFGVIPLKGKVLAIGTAVFVAISVLLNRDWILGAGYFTGMALGWAMSGGNFTPRLWMLKWRRNRLRKRYTVLSGGADVSRPPQKKWLN
jgi:membrane associated rhomboid family serine protease